MKNEEKRSVYIAFRVSENQRQMLQRKARLKNKSLAEYLYSELLKGILRAE